MGRKGREPAHRCEMTRTNKASQRCQQGVRYTVLRSCSGRSGTTNTTTNNSTTTSQRSGRHGLPPLLLNLQQSTVCRPTCANDDCDTCRMTKAPTGHLGACTALNAAKPPPHYRGVSSWTCYFFSASDDVYFRVRFWP